MDEAKEAKGARLTTRLRMLINSFLQKAKELALAGRTGVGRITCG
jgi:hypothetical protein